MKKKIETIGIALLAVTSVACMDRPLAPICPVPIEVKSNEVKVGGYLGVDMLVVVDNSLSMAEEQAILTEGFFTLIGALTEDTARKVDDVRVAIVSSDMGLQYGGQAPPVSVYKGICPSARGDDGAFKMDPTCVDFESRMYLETSADAPNPNLAEQFACAAKLGIEGCGIEQQLEAAVRGVERGKKEFDFVRDRYLLAVLVVSDEEDCSIEDAGLFKTPEWENKINTACNLPASNEENYLYPTSRYRKALAELKGSEERPDYDAVVFAAIVGVPNDDGGCQGPGDALGGCIERPEMEFVPYKKREGDNFLVFKEACMRFDAEGEEVTGATPGRRYVKVAQDFGDNGYVYSICNANWSPAMEKIAELIRDKTKGSCFDRALEWDPATETAKCDVFLKYRFETAGLPCPAELEAAEGSVIRKTVSDGGDFSYELVSCPLPKLPAPLACSEALAAVGEKPETLGWYYCKNDEQDDRSCRYRVELTEQAQVAAMPTVGVEVRCLSEFSFEDENCQENTNASCMDDRDNDGNGVWDCEDTPGVHEADPNCCPITKDAGGTCRVDAAAVAKICQVDPQTSEDLPGACLRAMVTLGCRGDPVVE